MTADQKRARRQLLVDTAWSLFQAEPYSAINMDDVARASGLAKGTLYLYFTTKETLFLAVLEEQFMVWLDAVDAALDGWPHPPSAQTTTGMPKDEALVTLLVDSLMTRPYLTRLFALAPIVLEQNIDYDTAHAYKLMLQDRLQSTGRRLEAHVDWLRPGQGGQFLLRVYALVIGLESLAHPAPIVAKVLAQETALPGFQIDFAAEFAALLRGLVLAMQRRASNAW